VWGQVFLWEAVVTTGSGRGQAHVPMDGSRFTARSGRGQAHVPTDSVVEGWRNLRTYSLGPS
jgi:hypothetical protein